MMETRVFVVISEDDDGLTLTLTPIEPDFPADGIVAAFRVPGAIAAGETTLHFPSASVLPTA